MVEDDDAQKMRDAERRIVAIEGVTFCYYGWDLEAEQWYAEALWDSDTLPVSKVQGDFDSPTQALEALADELEERYGQEPTGRVR